MANPRDEPSLIFHRPPLKLLNDARLTFRQSINVAKWDNSEPVARTMLPVPQGVSTIPDISNSAGSTTACVWESGGSSRCWTDTESGQR